MGKRLTRRDLLKGAAATLSYLAVDKGAAEGAEVAVPPLRTRGQVAPNGTILPLTSTSEVFIPPRGRSHFKFSFDFPEPSVVFGDHSFSYRLCTFENVYGLDREAMTVTPEGDGLLLECSGFVWAGGQQKAPGRLVSHIRPVGPFIEWDVAAEMDQPIKSVSSIVRGVPRGRIAGGMEPFVNHGEDEVLFGYPWGPARPEGDFIATPMAAVETGDGDYFFLSALLDGVHASRLYFQPGPDAYKVELVFEQDGWQRSERLEGGRWRAGRTRTADEAFRRHLEHVERTFSLPAWEARTDVPDWFHEVSLVMAIHGMHWTGYIFNDFAKALRTLEWTAEQIPGENVMVFLPAWDGRYYWKYPAYQVDERLGGEEGFRRLIREGQRMGFRFVPMFGMNAANALLPEYSRVADASTREIDGNPFNLAWVDWDNDRSNDGWGRFMNVGVESWRSWLRDAVSRMIDDYGVDGYFMDISAGWVNNPDADMHEGARRLVAELRERYPDVLPVGEFSYDALMEIFPVYHVFPSPSYPPGFERYCRTFSHLSHPAPGRGSSGVHEYGFGRFNTETLSLSPHEIPTITVVDDTFDEYRDEMLEIIAHARSGRP